MQFRSWRDCGSGEMIGVVVRGLVSTSGLAAKRSAAARHGVRALTTKSEGGLDLIGGELKRAFLVG